RALLGLRWGITRVLRGGGATGCVTLAMLALLHGGLQDSACRKGCALCGPWGRAGRWAAACGSSIGTNGGVLPVVLVRVPGPLVGLDADGGLGALALADSSTIGAGGLI